ncbi:hypothetical protein GGX14DRAFT_569138 [Mycena pura]|uniref:Uncharacterized protein n=1 Tax=Mycena pura TaxID=153505 RepID=A0AAD6V9U6_9AGAR|nr:hypothetical protein GGX14DRAFT_569138 [Mycena pura]
MTSVLSSGNVLPHSQRLRFIRSMKKLGDLLTDASLLVDQPVPSHTRAASASISRTPIDITDLDAPHSSTPSRNLFSLRLPKALASPTFHLSLNSPLTPVTPVIDPEILKQRKLAKVAATFGERVPPELVFPPTPPAARKGRQRSSTVSAPEVPRPAPGPCTSAASGAGATVVARRRHRRHARVVSLRHAVSSSSLRAHAAGPADEPFSYANLVPATLPLDLGPPSATATPVLFAPDAPGWNHTRSTMHRKEAGWSGEWSGRVSNMDDVVRGLRELRLT